MRERFAAGGLTHDQLDERLDGIFAAQRLSELNDLLPRQVEQPEGLVERSLHAGDLDEVGRHLTPGENVEWVGRPDPTKHFTRGDVFLVPFSILWGGFATFWEATAISDGAGAFFALWGIPFVLMGVYFVAGRFFYKAYRKRRTLYVVTNRRVMSIVRRRNGEAVASTYLRAIPNISTSAGSDGRGYVEFGNASPVGGWYGNTGMEFFGRGQVASSGVSFYDIEDPRGVADLTERLREQDHG